VAHYKNIKIFGGYTGNGCGITLGIAWAGGGQQCAGSIVNCSIYNLYAGIRIKWQNNYPRSNYIENCSIYNCANGFHTIAGDYVAGSGSFIRNVVCHNSSVADFSNEAGDATNNQYEACADHDNTLQGVVGTKTNCHTGVIDANFRSLDSASSDFLKLPIGYLSSAPTANPDRGLAPLAVRFNANTEYLVPNGLLATEGIAPTLAKNDLADFEYGKYGDYPIGCYNAEIAY
jgi:hypothetical protein